VVCGVVLERLDLAAMCYVCLDLGFGFMDATVMELAEKAERAIWKMN
jgi:hypothetical protein